MEILPKYVIINLSDTPPVGNISPTPIQGVRFHF